MEGKNKGLGQSVLSKAEQPAVPRASILDQPIKLKMERISIGPERFPELSFDWRK